MPIPSKTEKHFTVFSSAPLLRKADGYYAYGPYIREMEIWARHTGPMDFLCPVTTNADGLYTKIDFEIGRVYQAKAFDVKSASGVLRAVLCSIFNVALLFRAMRNAGHIHLRCPGNIGLLACIVQIFFPTKKKTAKYAGNWDPASPQPLSYRMQKWLLNNSLLTRKISVLVYGQWPGSSRNIKSFFTATYRDSDKRPLQIVKLTPPYEFVFAGTLAPGKRPQYAIELVEELIRRGAQCRLRIFGDGALRGELESLISQKSLGEAVFLMGNRSIEGVQRAYEESHFMILPSRSEGWPKVVAEAMFWGALPLSTPVSCVPYMLDGGSRGLLLTLDLKADTDMLIRLFEDSATYEQKVSAAAAWSRQFTLDLFEAEIKKLL